MGMTCKWSGIRNTDLVVFETSGTVYEMTASVKARSLVTMISVKSLGMRANNVNQDGQSTCSIVISSHSLTTFARE